MKIPKTILNPFKPGSGLFPPHLAGREEEISTFKSRLNIRAFSDLSRDIFERKFNEISNNERKIVAKLAEYHDTKGFTEILNVVKLPKGSISVSLARLKEKGILSQKEKKYFIADRLFAEYAKNKFQQWA